MDRIHHKRVAGIACVVMGWLLLATPALAGVSASITYGFQSDRFGSDPGTGSDFLKSASAQYSQGGVFGDASATAGAGSLSAFATSATASGANNPRGLYMNARTALSDSITILSDSALPLLLEFAAGASASLSASHPGGVTGISKSEVNWDIELTGPGVDFTTSGGITYQWNRRAPTFDYVLEIFERGIGLDDFVLAVGIPANSVGETFSLSMSATASASTSAPQTGTTSANADFGSTLNWLGLVSATLPDGTPYEGPLEIVSDSGFNYLESAAPVPLPAAAPVFALALLPLAALRRRRALSTTTS